jgi:glucose-6-phosphate dehydrogenase assembly protein OpcA
MASTIDTTDGTLSFLSGNLAQVDVAKIERELNKLWDSVGRDQGDWKPVIRACALNVVLLTDEGESEAQFDNLLGEITVRHPSRAILAVIARGEQEKVEAWVSARCHFLPGQMDKQVCCEQITVKCTAPEFRPVAMASVINPLVIPDLPSWLVAKSEKLSADMVEPFLSYINHLLIDSRQSGSLPEVTSLASLQEKWQVVLSLAERCVVVDLGWLAINSWRKAIALAFDDTDVSIDPKRLKALKSIDIKYGGGASGFSPALLLVSWLSSRLGYKPLKASFKAGVFRVVMKGGHELNVVIEPQDHAPHGLVSCEICFTDGDDKLNIDYVGSALKVVNGDNEEYMELSWSLARDKEAIDSDPLWTDLIDLAFEQYSADPIFLEAIAEASRFLALVV